jgi:predicted nucleic acid-binding protein
VGPDMALEELIIVTDAGPLLHLHWVQALDWALPNQPIHVVRSVMDEVTRHAPDAGADRRLLPVDDPPATAPELKGFSLDGGEAAALTLALEERERGQVLVLCDERLARSACAALGLPVAGSIGLILKAAESRRVALLTARSALLRLPTDGRFQIAPALLRWAQDELDRIGQSLQGDEP